MSVKVISWVWEHSVSTGSNRLVLLVIADHANDDGVDAFPSQATIARKARLSEMTVSTAIKRLVESGELEVLSQGGISHGARRSSRYKILMERQQQLQIPKTLGDLPGAEIPKTAALKSPRVLGGTVLEPSDTSGGAASPPSERPLAQRAVARYVDAYRANHQGRNPLKSWIGQTAKALREVAAERDERVVLAAADRLGREGRPPSWLPGIVSDLESDRDFREETQAQALSRIIQERGF